MPSIEIKRLRRQYLLQQINLIEEFMFCFTSHTKVHELILLRDMYEEELYSK